MIMYCIAPVDSVCLEDALHSGGSLLLFHTEGSAQREINRSVELKNRFKPYPVEIEIKPVVTKEKK